MMCGIFENIFFEVGLRFVFGVGEKFNLNLLFVVKVRIDEDWLFGFVKLWLLLSVVWCERFLVSEISVLLIIVGRVMCINVVVGVMWCIVGCF